MALAILKGQKVDGFVLGTKPKPAEFLKSTEGGETIELLSNPEFEEWNTVDQVLLDCLLGSMTPSIACDVMDYKNSRDVWTALEKLYGAFSKARVNQLRSAMQNTKKGKMKITNYLAYMKQTS
ncbi:uncharacterized protein LOC120067014 [Benincasa hispida]|uniref:uncharacterized protein LOC120067014 n=1 Tax=Benincasa hispida TaxID=102211 RepID=UPI0019016AC9|nr:uncharacterized protein LOC120067014 [Benincasa hispida]